MFESDDFDQILSQFDFPNATKELQDKNDTLSKKNVSSDVILPTIHIQNETKECMVPIKTRVEGTPKHNKRKIINSYFDHNNKRKFPGPAGILSGALQEPKDESICRMELLSQDIDFTQNNLRGDLFESPLWIRLLDDAKNIHNIDSIRSIKQQALAGNMRPRKAQAVTAFVETVDRSATDPLIILQDATGSIKCTLHRDAWSTFAPYIVSQYCALILWKPTVLTTGGAYKNHYLNITLSNILAIYSSAVLKDETDDNKTMLESYSISCEQDFTVIKADSPLETNRPPTNEPSTTDDLLDGLDSIFSDEVF